MDVSEMARGIGGLALPAGASVWVTDRNGTVLASQPPAAGRVGEAVPDDILARALREHGQVLSPLEMERDGWLLRAHPAGVDDAGQLWVAARMDRAVLAGEAGTRLLGILVLSIASFGLVALGVVLLSERYLWSPLQRLVSMARRVMRGDLAARSGQPPDRADEVGILASAMDTMAEALEARDLRQHEIEARLRALNANLDTAQRIALLGSWEANAPDGLLLSPEAARILGCSPLSPVVSIDALLARFEAADGARLRSALEAAMRDGSPFELELRLAGNLRQMLFRGETSVRDGGGPFIAYGTVQDVTERRRADDELQRAQARLLQADKLASIGELAAGLAHEINNPLGYVYSNLNTMAVYIETLLRLLDAVLNLERDGRLPPELARQLQELRAQTDFEYVGNDLLPVLDECREGLERVRKIVKDLRDFSRADQPADWAACDIHVPLERTLGILRSEFRQKAEVRREYGILPEVMCNEGQLQQVFMNLLVNAVQSIEQQGRITVRTGHSGDQVFVEIADNGCGIDPENLGNLFTPFFTTKRPGVGTGLGLSVSQTLVARHHGRIEAYSTVGEGSRFVVWLPVRQPEAGPELALPAVRAVASAPSMPS
jgi:two-component system, NtrC family, sensor kinase